MPAKGSTGSTNSKKKPAVWFVTQNFYNTIKAQAVREDGKLVFRGSIVQAYRSLNVSQGYYSEVVRGLEALGSILMVSRGARNTPTVIEVGKTPKFPEWQLKRDSFRGSHLTTGAGSGKLSRELERIQRQIGGIDLEEALKHMQQELEEIKQRVSVLERASNAEEPN